MKALRSLEKMCSLTLNVLLAAVAVLVLIDLPGMVPAWTGTPLAGWTAREVLTASMEPEYPVGSLVYFHETAPENVHVGDVIAFEGADGSVTAHRVVSIDAQAKTFTTKGDANESEDPAPIPFSSCIGTAKASIPLLGALLGNMQDKPLRTAGLVLGLGSLAYLAGVLARAAQDRIAHETQDRRRICTRSNSL